MKSKKSLNNGGLDDNLYNATHRINIEVSRKAEFVAGLRYCDQAISDILHHLELSKLTTKDLIEDARLLQRYRKERRRYKERLEMIKVSNSCNVKQLKKCAKGQKRRKYSPKVLKGLKINL